MATVGARASDTLYKSRYKSILVPENIAGQLIFFVEFGLGEANVVTIIVVSGIGLAMHAIVVYFDTLTKSCIRALRKATAAGGDILKLDKFDVFYFGLLASDRICIVCAYHDIKQYIQ